MRLGVFFLVLTFAGLLSSCSCGFHLLNRWDNGPSVRFVADPLANNTSAVAVDVVLIYDKALVDEFMALSAKDWFDSRAQQRRDRPDSTNSFQERLLELVPGQDTTLTMPRLHCARDVILFADYSNDVSAHRQRFNPGTDLRVDLREEDFEVTSITGR